MIPKDYITVGRKVYEPVRFPIGVNTHEITAICEHAVELVQLDEYVRRNNGKGRAGFTTTKLDAFYVSHREALHALTDMIETDLERVFPEYEFDILPIDKINEPHT